MSTEKWVISVDSVIEFKLSKVSLKKTFDSKNMLFRYFNIDLTEFLRCLSLIELSGSSLLMSIYIGGAI